MGPMRVLIVDGDEAGRGALRSALVEQPYEVAEAKEAGAAVARLAGADAVMVAASLPDGSAADLVKRARAAGSDAAFVVACGPGEMERGVEAVRAGADCCLALPAGAALAPTVLERALEARRLRRERGELREQARARAVLVGEAPELRAVHDIVRRVAPTKATVLVVGESGTGKSTTAQALHEASPRRERPFVRVNCAALSEVMLESQLFGHEKEAFAGAGGRADGRLSAAEGGTLHLAEVDNLSPASQTMLLRVLQHGEFERVGGRKTLRADVRVVASARRDLAEEVRAGRFRDDLYYRLGVVTVTLPPLRARKGDLPALANHFLDRCSRPDGSRAGGLTPGALSALFAYDWPGNVRELENVVARAARARSGTRIGPEDLSPVLRGARPAEQGDSRLIPGATLYEIEREAILRTLDREGGSTVRAAEVLGISVRKIQYRLKEYRTGHPQGARQRQVFLEAAEQA